MGSSKFKEYKGLDLPAVNSEVLERWDAVDAFGKSISTREGHPTFVFYEGPPSANGMPGIHHVMARTIKDVVCRYKTQRGFLVHRKAGWDTHGLPVELGVEKKLGITKEDIGTKISIEEYNRICRKEVMTYTDAWERLTRRMGYWIDMKDPYITYDNKYIETLWHLLAELYKKGLLYKGYTIQPYSPAAGTGLSNHELNQPGCYRDVKDTTCTALFRIVRDQQSERLFEGVDGDVYFMAWTTTPWTLPSNTALAVGPAIRYVRVRSFNPYTGAPLTVFLAKDLCPAYFPKKNEDLPMDGYEAGGKNVPFRVEGEYVGKDLAGIRYEPLLPWIAPDGDAFRVITGDYVTTEDGTGIVHIAPTFGADDDRVAKQSGIPPLVVVDRAGKRQPMVDRTGKFFRLEDLDPHARRCGGLRRVRGAVRQECLRPDAERGRSDARRRSLHEAQVRGQGVPHREAYAQLSPLLAYRQACAVLSARLVVHPHDGRQGPPDRAEPYDRLEARKYRFGPLRQVARKPRRLEPFALALLGNSAADLGYGGSRRAEVHRVGRRAESRDRPFGRGRLHVRESAEGFRRGRFQQGKLR